MKVLVTGGGGFIGSILVRMLLERGYDITVLDRLFFGREPLKDVEDQIKIIRDDIRWCEPSVLDGMDAVIDMAALSNDPAGELDPNKTLEINHQGRVRIAKLSKEHGVKRYLVPSSCSVYGFQEGVMDENSNTNPLTTYAKANILWENDVLPMAGNGFCVTVLRQATVYGLSPRMRLDLAINGMVMGFFKNGRIPILRDGKQWRPFVHVKDTSMAFIKALEADQELVNRQIFNVGSGDQNLQIFPLAEMVAKSIGVDFSYEWYGSPDNRSYRVSFDKIKNVLGFKPECTPEDGAKEVFKALKEGIVSPDDKKTKTVEWYKHLLENGSAAEEVKINGIVL